MCIENVYVWDNTSVIVDEVLSHRWGLVPLNVDPTLMIMKKSTLFLLSLYLFFVFIIYFFFYSGPTDQAMDRNTVVFHVDLTCERNTNAPKGSTKDHELYINHELLSSHLIWVPAGEQDEVFAGKPPAPINPNIVMAKLRPGQRVNMELHAVKGVGKDHAKFCPVGTFVSYFSTVLNLSLTSCLATASYRLLPHIKITKPIPFHLAQKFQKCFSPGVIKIDSRTDEVSVDEQNVRKDTVSREVLRHPEFADSVELSRVRDYFLCMSLCVSFLSSLVVDQVL